MFILLLALTSRCLQLVALYIPIVKDFFTQRLPPKQQVLLKNFDKIYKVSFRGKCRQNSSIETVIQTKMNAIKICVKVTSSGA